MAIVLVLKGQRASHRKDAKDAKKENYLIGKKTKGKRQTLISRIDTD